MKRGNAITMRSFLLVAVTSCAVVFGGNELVLDAYSRPVKAFTRYYPRQVSSKANMWLTTTNTSDPETPCLERRVVYTSVFSEDETIMFIPKQGAYVRVSTELNTVMSLDSKCDTLGIWRVADSSSKIKEVVLTGSMSSNDSIFTIQRAHRFLSIYKFAFGNSTDISFAEKGSDVPVFGSESAFVFLPR
ncbi:unnamed protein product [Eruca vesicaria subsp. sativa]|uniref:Uncharacterized protein n=1 Tax=Eruca vesicaria subsp. sativa TaxID=29727 RepID=A0ABC8LZB0_ERUVS|nr:unnamed protein product [Eruca vesicaria subsp. sativa]